MYAKFFGLNQDPFSIAPDPRYLFMSERHREALAHLLYGLGGGGGFVLLSGEVGTGKTTVCRCFLEQIPANCNVAYIFNPKLSVPELLRSICDEFHIELPAGAATAKDFIDPLNAFLLRGHAAGQNNVLIIDEAQNLSADVLEQLRLLTNLETSERKLLQIVLIGQPELRRMLARPELEQLAQRVIARFHLDALSEPETAHYIAHRLAVAGLAGASPFDAKAIARIHRLSRGVPRRINLLCGRALLGAYASGKAQVDKTTVDKAALEVFGPDIKPQGAAVPGELQPHPPARSNTALVGLIGLLAGGALAAGVFWALQSRQAVLAAAKPASAATATAAAPAASAPAGAASTPAAVTPTTASASAPLAAASSAASAPVQPALAAASAPQTNTAPPVQLVSQADISAAMAQNPTSLNQAWSSLGKAWGLTLTATDACDAAQKRGVYCFTGKQTALSLIRELDRPGIITLYGPDKTPFYAVLTGLDSQTATLRIGPQMMTVSLSVLAELWRGDFATLRRAPKGYAQSTANGKIKPSNEWLAIQLARVPGASPITAKKPTALDEAVRSRISAFQLAHGLAADGQAGSMTLMQLNRAIGVEEPRLNEQPKEAGNEIKP